MLTSRRRFAVCSVGVLAGVAGCADRTSDESLREIQLDLENRTDQTQTFHFALEAEDGLGEWHDFTLEPGTDREETVEPSPDREWIGYHAVAGDKQTSGTLFGQGSEQRCLQLDYRIESDEIAASLPTNQPRCEQ